MRKPIEVVAAILYSNKKILVGQRMVGDTNAGRWEFPGGKIDKGETPEKALEREIMEELGVKITAENMKLFHDIRHDYANYSVHILFYLVRMDEKFEINRTSHDELQWIDPKMISDLDFLEANLPVIEKLRTFFLGLDQ